MKQKLRAIVLALMLAALAVLATPRHAEASECGPTEYYLILNMLSSSGDYFESLSWLQFWCSQQQVQEVLDEVTDGCNDIYAPWYQALYGSCSAIYPDFMGTKMDLLSSALASRAY